MYYLYVLVVCTSAVRIIRRKWTWQTNQLDEEIVSTSIVPFETCPAVDAIAKDVNVSNRQESVETA